MKLLYCPSCGDCVTMRTNHDRICECGACKGRYVGTTKMVVSGRDVQVIAFNNHQFGPAISRAVRAVKGRPKDDYHLPKNEFEAWVFGPNALAVTKGTTQTDRDRRELAATATTTHYDRVTRLTEYLRQFSRETQQRMLADVADELVLLEPLGIITPVV